MSNIPRVYRSTDPGAPQLSGQPGSFAAIMDAVLVDGYGGGADFKPPLGWVREFSAVNKRVFRNDPAAYSGYRIRFDDSNAMFVLVDAYADMDSVDVGYERFSSASNAWAKSDSNNTGLRQWIAVGTSGRVYVVMWPQWNWQGADMRAHARFFGDLDVLGSEHNWPFAYSASGITSYVSGDWRSGIFTANAPQNYGMWCARSANGSSIGQVLLNRQSLFSAQVYFGTGAGQPYPLPTTGGVLLSRVILQEGGVPCAVLPGVWIIEHNNSHSGNGQIFTGFSSLPPGTQLMLVSSPGLHGQENNARAFIDITNPW